MTNNTKFIFLLVAVFFLVTFFLSSSQLKTANASYKGNIALICFYEGEMQSTFNKICFYDCLGTMYAINVKPYKLCPSSINKD
ncbi:MAG: hypothetical protein C0174_00950 [Thermodesulfobium narugense]|nr:MAG: hypothetical protein C0174_00950 [Thermodesulfobium narugense]